MALDPSAEMGFGGWELELCPVGRGGDVEKPSYCEQGDAGEMVDASRGTAGAPGTGRQPFCPAPDSLRAGSGTFARRSGHMPWALPWALERRGNQLKGLRLSWVLLRCMEEGPGVRHMWSVPERVWDIEGALRQAGVAPW